MSRRASLLLPLLLAWAPACGGSDDDCVWQRRCESIGGELTCVWVKVCPGDPGYEAGAASSSALLAPGASVDVRIGTAGGMGPDSLAAALLGGEVARRAEAWSKDRWWLSGWPAGEVEAALRRASSAQLELIRRGEPSQDGDGCRGRILAHALPPLPTGVASGEPWRLLAPSAIPGVPEAAYLGAALCLTPPRGREVQTRFLGWDESIEVVLDEPGRWHVRMVLFAEDVCEPGVGDAIVVQDGDVEVADAR